MHTLYMSCVWSNSCSKFRHVVMRNVSTCCGVDAHIQHKIPIFVHVCTLVRTHVHTFIHTYIHIFLYMHAYIHTQIHRITYTHTTTHAY